jgi:hypothetical protein
VLKNGASGRDPMLRGFWKIIYYCKNNVAAFFRRDIVFMGFDSTRKLLTISGAFDYFSLFGITFHIVEYFEAHHTGAAL